MSKYNKLTSGSLKGEILIYIRKKHIEQVAKEILKNDIISIEYLDSKIKLETDKTITDDIRLKYIIDNLSKICNSQTSRLINELSN
jgi:hypothetical protein